MNLKLVGKTFIGGKQFGIQDSDGTIQKTQYGLSDDFYGGMLKEFRKTKYGILLCLDKRDNVINLAYIESDLTDEGRKLLDLEVEEFEQENNEASNETDVITEESNTTPESKIDEIISSKTTRRR